METEQQSTIRKRAFAAAAAAGLTREDRHDLAEMILKVDCTSWGRLSDAQMARLVDALEGFALVTHLLEQRP